MSLLRRMDNTDNSVEEKRLAAIRAAAKQAAMAQRRPYEQWMGYDSLKIRIQKRLLNELDPRMEIDIWRKDEIRREIQDLFNNILAEENMLLSKRERERLFESIVADILGLGPLEPLLSDETIAGIFVRDPRTVFIEQRGRNTLSGISFENREHVERIAQRIASPFGIIAVNGDEACHVRLADGSLATINPSPSTDTDPILSIRKLSGRTPITIQDLIRYGSMTPEVAQFLRACVIGKIRTLVVANLNAGAKSLVNVLAGFMPNDQRVITLERYAQYMLQQEHVLTLESGYAKSIEALPLDLALSHQPDVLCLGDLLTEDIPAFIEASLRLPTYAILRANNAEQGLKRLEMGMMQAHPRLDLTTIRDVIIDALDMIVVMARLRDGSIKVMQVVEVERLQTGRYELHTIYEFEQTGFEGNKIVGRIRPSGLRPAFSQRIENAGINLPPSIFGLGMRR